MINKLLFPVDFSPSCSAMGPYVERAAKLFSSRVTLVHVCDVESHNGFELSVRSPQEIAEEHWNLAQRKIVSFLASQFPLEACPRILVSGEPAGQIAKLAHCGQFDLIIMPTHAGRFRQMLLGSTTAKILNDADCAVLTTEHAETNIPKPLERRSWVCGISLGDDSERVLRVASLAAAAVGASLSIVHVLHESSHRENARAHLNQIQKTIGCQANIRFAVGPVKEALLDETARFAADALIIGRKPKSGALGRIRDLAYGVIRDSPVPVLSV